MTSDGTSFRKEANASLKRDSLAAVAMQVFKGIPSKNEGVALSCYLARED
jgi:hypothetical protein